MLYGTESNEEQLCDNMGIEELGGITPEVKEYILHLQSRLNSMKKVEPYSHKKQFAFCIKLENDMDAVLIEIQMELMFSPLLSYFILHISFILHF